MPQDLFTIRRTTEHLSKRLVGAKINKIFQPTVEEVDLLVYKDTPLRVVISTNAKFARVSITDSEKPNPDVAFNFCMLLRKYLSGAEITGVEVFNDDRIIKISLTNKNDLQDSEVYALYAEIMGKYSNLFFTKNGVILGASKQSQDIDGKRLILTGAKYSPPNKQNKISAFSKDAERVFNSYAGGALDLYILQSFADFSPITAREIAYRIELLSDYNGEKAYKIFKEFINQTTLPTVIDDGVKLDFYPFNYLSVDGQRHTYETLDKAIESVYSKTENLNFLKGLKSGVMNAILGYEKRLNKRLTTLNERILESRDFEVYKKYGELITSQIYLVKKGLTKVSLVDYFDGGNIEISLDDTLTPQQNAQRYFKAYKKKKSAVQISKSQIESAEEELNYILSVKFYLDQAENKQEIEDIRQELISIGIIKSQQNKKAKKQKDTVKFKKYQVLGFTATLGKNNLQNDKLLTLADKNDCWFHVKNYHSSHLIVNTGGNEIPENVIKICAEICAYYSQGGKQDKLQVDYAKRRYVKKQGGKNLGAVTYENYKTITVIPNAHKELEIN